MSMLRLVARSSAAPQLLRRGAALAPLQRRSMGAVSNQIDMNVGRTPERTAELEKLAEEHNGFLFGEIVRWPGAPLLRRACERSWLTHPPTPARPPFFGSRSPRASRASGRIGSTRTRLS